MLGRGAQRLVGAGEPLVELGEVHGVVDGVHALGVAHRLELLGDVAAHALGVGLGADELGVRRLNSLELLEQAVELGIRDLRLIERVIAVGIGVEQAVELRRARTGARGAGRLARGRRSVPKERPLRTRHAVLFHRASPAFRSKPIEFAQHFTL